MPEEKYGLPIERSDDNELLIHLTELHTTEMGVERIRKNLQLKVEDVVEWCRVAIEKEDTVLYRKGKNWYADIGKAILTVNAKSYTIITAHRYK